MKSDKKEEPFEICDSDCDKDKKIEELNKLLKDSRTAFKSEIAVLKTLLKAENLNESEKIFSSFEKMQKVCDNMTKYGPDNMNSQGEEKVKEKPTKKPANFFLEAGIHLVL